MDADTSDPEELNSISMNFPNRDELSFRTVRAFPKDSKIGLDCRTVFLFLGEEKSVSQVTRENGATFPKTYLLVVHTLRFNTILIPSTVWSFKLIWVISILSLC